MTDPVTTSNTTSDERTMALLAHVLGIFTGFLGPLILWLVKKDNSPFAERHAREALNFQITAAIAYLVGFVLTIILIGPLISLAVFIASVIFGVMGAIAANKGQEYRYPIALRLVKAPGNAAAKPATA